jgi:hypothetical protein
MKRKFGIIVKVPNYILKNYPDSPYYVNEIADLIMDYMDIDTDKCYIDIKQDFITNISLVKLTSDKPVDGLFLHNSFS